MPWSSKPNRSECTKILKTFPGNIPSNGLPSAVWRKSLQNCKNWHPRFAKWSICRPLNETGSTRWWISWIDMKAASTLEPAPNSHEQLTLNLAKTRHPMALDDTVHRTPWKLLFFGKHWKSFGFVLFEMRALQIAKDSSSDSTALILNNCVIAWPSGWVPGGPSIQSLAEGSGQEALIGRGY